MLNSTASSLAEISRGNQQVLRLQQIKGDVFGADALAPSGLALGTPASAETGYNAALQQAAQLTVEASQAQPLDQSDLTAVNAGLLNYVLTMERARTAFPKDNSGGIASVNQASDLLQKETVPALDKLIAANTARVDAARASDRLWAAGLALVPVLVLVGVSILVARRTRRLVNIGLLVALAASIVLWRLVDTNLLQSASVVDSARAGSLQTATSAATGYSELARAKAIEGHQLLQPSRVAELEPTWTQALGVTTSMTGNLGDASAGVKTNVTGYSTAHTALTALLRANKLTDAKASAGSTTTGVTPTYQAASEGLSEVFSSATADTVNDISRQQNGLWIAGVLALLLGVLGAVASWIGVAGRLKEFR